MIENTNNSYGLPYQGSKAKIAEQILALFPPATHFVDVFAGGCAISHAALLSGKYEHVHANDITDSVVLFKDALNGDLAKYEPERFRSRMDFFMEKDENPFVRICYSFSNDQRTYLYGSDIEPYKRAVHEMIYAPTPNERRLKFKAVIREMEKLGVFGGNTPPPRTTECCSSSQSKTQIGLPQLPPPRNVITRHQSEEAACRVKSLHVLIQAERNEQKK